MKIRWIISVNQKIIGMIENESDAKEIFDSLNKSFSEMNKANNLKSDVEVRMQRHVWINGMYQVNGPMFGFGFSKSN